MQFLRLRWSFAVCVSAALVLLASLAATAKDGRDFAGYFDVSDVHEQGELVQITLHLQLFNNGEGDVRNAIVALMESGPAVNLRGSFPPVRLWKRQQPIRMNQQFTVTRREFGEWMSGPAQPNLLIMFQDAKGQSWQRGAQMSRRPLVPRD
jgi:hypothetical protein